MIMAFICLQHFIQLLACACGRSADSHVAPYAISKALVNWIQTRDGKRLCRFPYPDCKQATLQTSWNDDSRVWDGVGYSRSVATGGSARLATGKRRGGAGADRIGQDLHLRAALSEPENSGGVHRPDPGTR